MLRMLKGALFTLGLSLAAMPVLADVAAADQLIQRLKNITTFKAHFVQNIQGAQGEKMAKTQGELVVSRPGKLYWKTQKPDTTIVIADGKFVWTYDVELEQVIQQELKEALRNSPASLLMGDTTKISGTFDIAFAKNCGEKQLCYQLTPKEKDSAFSTIHLRFVDDKLSEVRMHDPLGQKVHTKFSGIVVNQSVDQKLFNFTPPKGVDVIQAGK